MQISFAFIRVYPFRKINEAEGEAKKSKAIRWGVKM